MRVTITKNCIVQNTWHFSHTLYLFGWPTYLIFIKDIELRLLQQLRLSQIRNKCPTIQVGHGMVEFFAQEEMKWRRVGDNGKGFLVAVELSNFVCVDCVSLFVWFE